MLSQLKRNVFVIYIIFAFFISWLGWLALILTDTEPGFFNPWKLLAAFGPSLAGVLAISIHGGKSGLRNCWHHLSNLQKQWYWYLISLLAPPTIMLIALGTHICLGGGGLAFNDLSEIYRVIPVFVLVLIFSVFSEEIGWRGFALPWLQKRYNAFLSSLILGLIWSLWHLPLFWIPGDFHQQLPLTWFVIQTMSITILYTWIYNATDGSLLIIFLLHTSSNTAFGVLPMLPEATSGTLRPAWILNILLVITAGLVILLNGTTTMAKNKSKVMLK